MSFLQKLRLLSFAGLCVAGQGWAVPSDVSQVFDKNKRNLDAPPSSLRSDDVNATTRYSVAEDSVERVLEVDTSGAAEVSEVSSQGVVVNDGIRKQQRSVRLNEYAFSGKRIFGLGFVGAGSYGIFGAEVEFGFDNSWSGGFGIGTGMTYSTWGIHARKYFQSGSLSPYFQVGYANWIMNQNPQRDSEIYPLYLGEQFLMNSDGSFKVKDRVHLLYPALGVIFQSSSGLAFTLHLQYLISALDFTGALAGAFGLHFYF